MDSGKCPNCGQPTPDYRLWRTNMEIVDLEGNWCGPCVWERCHLAHHDAKRNREEIDANS